MRLTITTFLTVDGVMQGPGGPEEDRSNGFDHGGWLVPFADDDMGRYVSEWFAQAEAFLFGRKTYEIMAAYWPQVTDENDPVAGPINRLPKYVASSTLDRLDWQNSHLIADDLVSRVAKLKEQPGGELQVHGSGELARTLIEHNLIDEYRLWIYPVVLGAGKRLFTEGVTPTSLRLVDTKLTSTGVAVHSYQPAGKPEVGSFAL